MKIIAIVVGALLAAALAQIVGVEEVLTARTALSDAA